MVQLNPDQAESWPIEERIDDWTTPLMSGITAQELGRRWH